MQKFEPTLMQGQTKHALQMCKDFYTKGTKVSQDEKLAQSGRERQTLIRKLVAGVLKDLGFRGKL